MINPLSSSFSIEKGGKWLLTPFLLALMLVCVVGAPRPATADSGTLSFTATDPCDQNNPQSLQYMLIQAATSNTAAAVIMAQQTYRQLPVTDMSKCILRVVTYFQTIKDLLTSVTSAVAMVVLGVLSAVLNQVCQFIVTGINALLSSVCIPVPKLDFNLNMSMPGMPTTSCDGMSLMNYMSVSGSTQNLPSPVSNYSIQNMMLMTPKKPSKPLSIPVF
jgi:hypothetical protein